MIFNVLLYEISIKINEFNFEECSNMTSEKQLNTINEYNLDDFNNKILEMSNDSLLEGN